MTPLESLAGGAPLAVDVTSIERELAALWKSAAAPGAEAPAITRACQFNLVVCCDGSDQARAVDAILAAIAADCPNRAILAVVEGKGADRLDAAISAHCAVDPARGGGRQVCCEQITLTGGGRGAGRLSGAVLPLLLPELPVAVWCPGDPPLDRPGVLGDVVRAILEDADRVVIDSRGASRPWDTMRALASLDVAASDLAWQRLRGWREMVASFFDSPGFEDVPARIHRLEVTWAAPRGGSAAGAEAPGASEAILLACWAASRLHWAPTGGGRLVRPGDHPGDIALQGVPSDRPTGQVLSFVLESEGAAFRIERSEVLDCVTATVAVPEACPIPRSARVPEREQAALLCRSLEPSGIDPVHMEALRLAARLAGAPPSGETR